MDTIMQLLISKDDDIFKNNVIYAHNLCLKTYTNIYMFVHVWMHTKSMSDIFYYNELQRKCSW